MTGWRPASPLAKAVELAGFLYDPDEDIIYSRSAALQRNFGYAYGFDAAALLMGANIDSEPIFFSYGGKQWMIELWKGQYGLETGCEIGVYTRPTDGAPWFYPLLDQTIGVREHDPDPSHGRFFGCANDDELLQMSFKLMRNGETLFTRGPEKHWWLTGFKWGEYSDPSDLVMDLTIAMPDAAMRSAFVAALSALGYGVTVDGDTVCFTFAEPVTYQPRLHSELRPAVEAANREIVAAYNGFRFPNNDPNQISGDIARRIESAIAMRDADAYGRAIAEAFRQTGRVADDVAKVLTTQLGVAATTVLRWVTDAGYGLREWIGSLAAALQQTVQDLFTMNYSSVVEIDNGGSGRVSPSELTRVDFGVKKRGLFNDQECGHYIVEPPATIAPGQVARFYLKDNFGTQGAEGWANYSYIDQSGNRRTVNFTFGCPTGFEDNYATTSDSNFKVAVRFGDDPAWHDSIGAANRGFGRNHPLSAAYVLGGGQPR